MPATLDFNCDLGEGAGDDAAIVTAITSASLACGLHAGDLRGMREAALLCLAHGVAIGAHPSLDDREGFGRRDLSLTPEHAHALTSRQLETLADVVAAAGGRLAHVKPHGALYNRAARDPDVARAIAEAVAGFDRTLILYGLADSALTDAGLALGLRVAHEAFAERRYRADGSLLPRDRPGACIETLDEALAQVRALLRDGAVLADDGRRVPIRADTLCLHGDRPDAAVFAHALRRALEAEGVTVRAPDRSAL